MLIMAMSDPGIFLDIFGHRLIIRIVLMAIANEARLVEPILSA